MQQLEKVVFSILETTIKRPNQMKKKKPYISPLAKFVMLGEKERGKIYEKALAAATKRQLEIIEKAKESV